MVPLSEAEAVVAPIYEQVAVGTPGMVRPELCVVAGPGARRPRVAASGRR